MPDILYVVVPCYNEEEVLPTTAKELKEKVIALQNAGKISPLSKILFVDDGSKDNTWSIIEKYYTDDKEHFAGLKLSRNQGHQNALLAGLMAAKEHGDMIISIDADLQDDLMVIDGFIEEYYKGNQIVYGVRSDRTTDSAFKRMTAQGFYKMMKFLGVDIVYNHADCRLMSKLTLEKLEEFKEVNLFLRGVVPLIGYQTSTVEYPRNKRVAGESKYPLKKMLNFAWDGVTSFSVRPIRLIAILGFLVFAISLGLIVYSFLRNLMGNTVPGWSSLMISIWILGGLQILSIGIVGEYIGKMYAETKKRPKYFVETLLDTNAKKEKK